jgi:hypothetical protein
MAERHQQRPVAAEPNDFDRNARRIARRLDITQIADPDRWPRRFDRKPDHVHDASVPGNGLGGAHARDVIVEV